MTLNLMSAKPLLLQATRGPKSLDDVQSEQVPPEISQALLPPLEITLPDGGKFPLDPRFDLVVSDASAPDVFMGRV